MMHDDSNNPYYFIIQSTDSSRRHDELAEEKENGIKTLRIIRHVHHELAEVIAVIVRLGPQSRCNLPLEWRLWRRSMLDLRTVRSQCSEHGSCDLPKFK
eukprot:14609870-Heterocapsa_arctica.AAC.1